jgi:hypothetical protein
VKAPNHPPAASSAPDISSRRPRFTRRQETLTIGWLRALARPANTSGTPPAPSRAREETRSR